VPGVPGHETGSRGEDDSQGEPEASEKFAQQKSPERANSAQTTLHSVSHKPFIGDFEYPINSFSTAAESKDGLNIYPSENTNRSKFQQTENTQSTEETQKYSSDRDRSGVIIAFPGTSDETELDDVQLIYPEDGSDTNTDDWNMSDGDLPLRHMAELQLFKPDYNSTNLAETPKASSIIERMFPENVASHREYKGIQGRKEMQENVEDQEDEDGEERIIDEHDNNSSHNGSQAESPAHGHVLTHVQNKGTYVPKRSFISENLKMRISQLASGEERPGPRGNTAADTEQSIKGRHHTGQRSSQSFHATSTSHAKTDRNTSPASSVRRNTGAQSRSNVKNSTGMSADPTAILCASRIQNIFPRQFEGNVSQRGSHLPQGSVQPQMQQMGELSATKPTDRNGTVEDIHPVARRVKETLHGTFGARTRTRGRQTSPSCADIKTDGATDSAVSKFVHNQQTGQVVTEHPSLGSDARQSVKGDISVEGPGPIHVVGPIPKGFTDPVTLQNTDSVNQRDPLFHLPYNIQAQPFLNQISNSKVPQISASVAPSSSGISSFNSDMSVFHHQQPQSFHQQDVPRHAGNQSPQKYIQTLTATPSANIANFDRHRWQENQQNQLPSIQQADLVAPRESSPLIGQKFNLPSTHNLAEFNKPLLFHLPTPTPQETTPTHVPVAAVHSALDDDPTRAKVILLPQTSPLQKFLRVSDQQLKQLGEHKERLVPLSTLSSTLRAEGRPALPQQDARRHAAEMEYSQKLQEYFHQLQEYYSQQRHT
jgi:hypothetical protein